MLQGGYHRRGVGGKKSQLPWGDVELGQFKHLSPGDPHVPWGPAPLLAQQGLTTRKREREVGLKAEEGDQQLSRDASSLIKHLMQLR